MEGHLTTTIHPNRLRELDGLRGVAALIVVAFHYLCMLRPQWVPEMTETPPRVADTPLGILWNGPFAVSVFFVLSGFVVAAAADRRRRDVAMNLITRYLRLAVPVTASVIFAWLLLSAFPDATARLQAASPDPSAWLEHTLQGDAIPPLSAAIAHGLFGAFRDGGSLFNTVLWTMKIELAGSIFLYLVYWMFAGRLRLIVLALSGLPFVLLLFDPYIGFVLGALLYEARRGGVFARMREGLREWLAPLALVLGVVLGALSHGAAERFGLPPAPQSWTIGYPYGVWPPVAAALIIFAVLNMRGLARLLSTPAPLWLGRISFGLYLTHVPLLYTLVAWAVLRFDMPLVLLAALYLPLALAVAYVFTLAVDAPTLAALRRMRTLRLPLLRRPRAAA